MGRVATVLFRLNSSRLVNVNTLEKQLPDLMQLLHLPNCDPRYRKIKLSGGNNGN